MTKRRSTRLGRLWAYLGEMFPPAVQLPASVVSTLSIYLPLGALEGRAPLVLTWRAGVCALAVFLLALLMRTYDELKDVETDLRLGRAGDPRYKDRAIVQGRVRVDDLHALRLAATGLVVAINLPLGPLPLSAFAVAFGVGWLSFKWFFWPAISRNLLLAFVTHNPIALLFGGYVTAVYAADFSLRAPAKLVALLLIGLWLPAAAWETGRKIRCPKDETDYQTYSKMLGFRVAAFLPAFFVCSSVACILPLAQELRIASPFSAALISAAALVVGACVRFRLHPSTKSSAHLRPLVELYALVLGAGLPLSLWLERGVTVR